MVRLSVQTHTAYYTAIDVMATLTVQMARTSLIAVRKFLISLTHIVRKIYFIDLFSILP